MFQTNNLITLKACPMIRSTANSKDHYTFSMMCLFWKINKLNSDFWNRGLGEGEDGGTAKWKTFRRPKFLN